MVHPIPLVLALLALTTARAQQAIPPYVKQCQLSGPRLQDCLKGALHHLRPYLVHGIPEIELPSVEPFVLDSLSLALTGGDRGYKITLRDIHIYGLSNFTVNNIKLGQPFEARVLIPQLAIDANYTSSGVLLILPASGGGLFHANLGNVLATIKGTTSITRRDGKDYLKVEKLDVNLQIKDIKMQVRKIFNNNRILTEATNLFLRENGHEVLGVMMPQLRIKMAAVIRKMVNHLLTHTPVQMMVYP